MEKKLKIALCVLIIVLISIIGFVGVYSKGTISYESDMPDYTLASELTGKRITYFTVDTSEEEVIYDQDGNEVDEIPEDANEEDYTTETVKANSDESLTAENYELVKEIFEGRLEDLGVEDYLVRVDKETGDVIVELEDNTITDTMLQYLLAQGDFSMTDSEDGTVLLEKSDVKEASVVYSSSSSGAIVVYLDIKFTSEGTKKLEEVSQNYLEIEDDDEEEEAEETDETEETEDSEEETQKMVTMTLEGTEFLTTYFSEVITNGELTISLGSGTDTETVYEYATLAQVYAVLINNDEMPITYTITSSEYVANESGNTAIYVLIGIIAVIVVLSIVYMIVKFRLDGATCSLAFVSAIAIFLILVRYTSTTISISGILAMIALILLDVYFMIKILRNIKENSELDNVKSVTLKEYLKGIDLIIVLLIVAIIFTFMSAVEAYSIGMALFYGVISLIVSNLVFMRIMLIEKYKENE